jgi:hypothetical protein
MINFYFSDFAKLVFAFVLAFLQSDAATAHTSMLTVGDEIDGMILTKGAADARPLWVFCASEVSDHVITADCQVPQLSKLAIGHVFLGTDHAFSETKWSELQWELYLDDQYINLDQFGTYDYLLPTMAPNPSFVREVFMKFTAWDVVLTNLQPGVHTLEGRVRTGAEEYSWVVNLVIEESALGHGDQGGRKPGHTLSKCSRNGVWLSPFHNSCMLYV